MKNKAGIYVSLVNHDLPDHDNYCQATLLQGLRRSSPRCTTLEIEVVVQSAGDVLFSKQDWTNNQTPQILNSVSPCFGGTGGSQCSISQNCTRRKKTKDQRVPRKRKHRQVDEMANSVEMPGRVVSRDSWEDPPSSESKFQASRKLIDGERARFE